MTRHDRLFDAYIICATPRSGTTLLCGMLSKTGVAGQPDSFYCSPSIFDWAQYWGLPEQDEVNEEEYTQAYLASARRDGTGSSTLFGMRLMPENLGDFSDRLGTIYPDLAEDGARIEMAFGRTLYIHLSRADKIAQAVSLFKATQTGLWHKAPDGTELERTPPPREPIYDATKIRQIIEANASSDAAWNRWFAANGIEPFCIRYESLSADPAATVADIFERLGLDKSLARGVVPGVAKLFDATSRDWIDRYCLDIVGAGRFRPAT